MKAEKSGLACMRDYIASYRVSDIIMRQLLLWVHHDNNGIFTCNDIQLKFSHFLHKNTYVEALICCFDLHLNTL